jgi:hypothetical protein
MNKAFPAKPNSRTKTGAHRPFESDNRRLSNQKPLLSAHFTQTLAGTDPRQLSDKNQRAKASPASLALRRVAVLTPTPSPVRAQLRAYSLFTVNSAACGRLTNTVRSVTIIDIMKKRRTMANIQKIDYPEPRQALAVKTVRYSLLIIHLPPPCTFMEFMRVVGSLCVPH